MNDLIFAVMLQCMSDDYIVSVWFDKDDAMKEARKVAANPERYAKECDFRGDAKLMAVQVLKGTIGGRESFGLIETIEFSEEEKS